jgi:enoyl-CoA hydratase/carnithine racemase
MTMTRIEDYSQRYTRAAVRREGGVLQITLHDGNGSSLVWDESAHRELPELFHDVASDPDIRVVILTGSDDVFCASIDRTSWPDGSWHKIFTEGRRLLENLLSIEVPMIAAINGPARWHAELAVLCDIVLAAEHADFQDGPHLPHAVPGDGVHTVWPTLLGPNRGRYFLLMKEILDAHEAKRLGVVHEVLEKDQLLPRAWEIARHFDKHDPLTLRYTRLALTQTLKRSVLPDLAYGLALEGLSMLDRRPDLLLSTRGISHASGSSRSMCITIISFGL